MNKRKRFFIISMPIIMAICSLFFICDYVDAAPRTAVRSAPAARKSVGTAPKTQTTTTAEIKTESESEPTVVEPVVEEEAEDLIIENKSSQFNVFVSEMLESATEDNSFAEMIRKQRAALAASESASNVTASVKSGQNSCDVALRKCMMKTCGNDFTKCATDGDTLFGDKLNKCRKDIECTGSEFKLFTAEIKADRDMNVKLSSYDRVISCGNQYNACIVNECGTTYSKCLGRAAENAAIQKCATIARECTAADSGLSSRFNTVIGKLRENAEKDIKKDEKRLYDLRDLMKKQCTSLGAMFDERTFDCIYTVNFFAGDNQTTPTASRKRYAGDTFVCMQEWFGVNATTFKENAYRETRAQTAASSAMLGSGVGTAVGLVTSGAMGRALETQKAKKALKAEEQKQECEKNGGTWKDGKCDENANTNPDEATQKAECEKDGTKEYKKGECVAKNAESTEPENAATDCTAEMQQTDKRVLKAERNAQGECEIKSCSTGFRLNADGECELDPEYNAEEPVEETIFEENDDCTGVAKAKDAHATKGTFKNGNCIITECGDDYTPSNDGTSCVAPAGGGG